MTFNFKSKGTTIAKVGAAYEYMESPRLSVPRAEI